MKEIKLTQGKVAIVDDEDYEELSKHKWCHNQGYAVRAGSMVGGKRKTILMHVAIMSKVEGLEVDHVTGDTLDNRRGNLRYATKAQNQYNSISPRGTSAYKGVHWYKQTKKWAAKISVGGNGYHLGYYDSERDAAWVYNVWAESIFGEYARLNVLEP